jgi:hypothetical protein
MNTRIAGGAATIADVKCYHCGHISGHIVGVRGAPLRVANFVPRRGYAGPAVRPGSRLRCERCSGPVFLEEATNPSPIERGPLKLVRSRTAVEGPSKAA